MTTMTEPTTRTLDAPGAILTYDVRPVDSSTSPALLLIGSPMGAGGFGTLAGHFTDRTVITYDPRGVERSTKADPASPVHARAARRRPASDHRRARRGSRRPLRQQRWRGQRARPRREAPGAGSDARRARAAARVDPARSRGRDGVHPGDRRHVPAQRFRSGDGAVHRRREPRGRDHAGIRGPAGAGSGDVRHARRGRRQPHRPAAFQNIVTCTHYEPDFDALRAASTRIVMAAGVESGRRWRTAAPSPSPSASARIR